MYAHVYMEKYLQPLLVLCQICGQKKEPKEKEDVSKQASNIEKIWGISVLLDYPNVHPGSISIKCRVKCKVQNTWQGSSVHGLATKMAVPFVFKYL